MGSGGALHLGGRRRLRAPPPPDAARPGARVGVGVQQAQGGVEGALLPHPGLPAPTGRDAVAAVLLEVAVQVVRAHESLKAARALIGAQAGVHAHVVLQVVVVSKGGSALSTKVRLLSCMLPHVNLELVLPGRKKRKNSRTKKNEKCHRGSTHSDPNPLGAKAASFGFSFVTPCTNI